MKIFERVLEFVKRRKARAYLVGGAVRDILLDRARYDIDLAVVGNASNLARAFADESGGAFYVLDAEHDVARVIYMSDDARYLIDFAGARGDSIEEDLATRDFTINAMAADISGGKWDPAAIVDPFDGCDDLGAHRIRAVASAVFQNDPVRLLRATRFEAQLRFTLDAATENWIRRDAALLLDAAPERVRDEFYKLLAAENPMRQLRRLDELGLLEFLLPEVTALKGVAQSAPHVYDVFEHTLWAVDAVAETQRDQYANLAAGAFAEQLGLHFGGVVASGHDRAVLLRLAALLHDVGKAKTRSVDPAGKIHFIGHEHVGAEISARALRRLRFSNDEIALVTTILAQHLRPILLAYDARVSDRAAYHFFRDAGAAGVDVAVHAWCDQRATYGDTVNTEAQTNMQAVLARLLDRYYHARAQTVAPPPLLNGRDVMQVLGVAPGPRVGEILEALREAQAVGEVTTHEEAVEFVKTIKSERAA